MLLDARWGVTAFRCGYSLLWVVKGGETGCLRWSANLTDWLKYCYLAAGHCTGKDLDGAFDRWGGDGRWGRVADHVLWYGALVMGEIALITFIHVFLEILHRRTVGYGLGYLSSLVSYWLRYWGQVWVGTAMSAWVKIVSELISRDSSGGRRLIGGRIKWGIMKLGARERERDCRVTLFLHLTGRCAQTRSRSSFVHWAFSETDT